MELKTCFHSLEEWLQWRPITTSILSRKSPISVSVYIIFSWKDSVCLIYSLLFICLFFNSESACFCSSLLSSFFALALLCVLTKAKWDRIVSVISGDFYTRTFIILDECSVNIWFSCHESTERFKHHCAGSDRLPRWLAQRCLKRTVFLVALFLTYIQGKVIK
jgi:hypothetical protein